MGVGTWIENRFKASPKNLPPSALGFVYNDGGRTMARANVRMFRNWAEHGEWVRALINLRRDQISQAEWAIMPLDPEKPFSEALRRQVTNVVAYPNPAQKTFRTLIEMVLEDHLVLDAGVMEKEFTLRGQIARLWPVDAGTIRVSATWDGEDPDESRYFWYPDHQKRAEYTDREMVYMMGNASTYRVVGLSMLETLKMAIDSELGSSSYNDRQMRSAAPDGMLDLGENARPDQVQDFQRFWASEVAGRGAMAIVGGTRGAKWVPFRQTNRDAQFMEWQLYLVKKICAVGKVSPQDIGFTQDINRANGDVAQENTEDRGIRTLLSLVQDTITGDVVHDPGFGGPDNNLAFRFTALNLKESLSQARINQVALGGVPWKTIDEARRDDGRPLIGGTLGKSLIMSGPSGPLLLVEGEIPTAMEALEAKSKPPEPPGGGLPATKATEPLLVAAGHAETEGEP